MDSSTLKTNLISFYFLILSGAWYKHDNEDRPLFILRLGVMDVKGIIKSVSWTIYLHIMTRIPSIKIKKLAMQTFALINLMVSFRLEKKGWKNWPFTYVKKVFAWQKKLLIVWTGKNQGYENILFPQQMFTPITMTPMK